MMRGKLLRLVFCSLLALCSLAPVWSQVAAQIIQNAVEKSSSDNASLPTIIQEVEKAAITADASNQRSLYTFLGSLTEQLGDYGSAASWYAKAAGISAAPAPNTPAFTSEELVLAAVRCSLSCGESQQAEGYLAFLGNSTNEKTQAYARLYKMWSTLSTVNSSQQLSEPVAVLQSYATMASMKWVRSSVYLTLWYLTGNAEWSSKLQKEYPESAETAVVTGKAQILPTPFWFFLPRTEVAYNSATESKATTASSENKSSGTSASNTKTDKASTSSSAESHVILRQQVGFFRNKENAENLVARLTEAGFKSDITKEVRASGTSYFVVTVPEDAQKSMGMKLKTAGFECYPVFADE